MRRLGIVLGTVVVVASLVGCGGGGAPQNTVKVTRAEFGRRWPFKRYSTATLRCDDEFGGMVVMTTPDGLEWGLNGTAADHGYKDIAPIWRMSPENEPGLDLRVDVGPIVSRGLALCGFSR